MNSPRLGKYRLIAELARGGMGIVWLASIRGPGGFAKACVVKELLPELAHDPHHRAMFFDEASLAARLAHKNIVQTNEVGAEGARLYMALELLDGCSLRRVQDLGGRIPTALAVRVASEVLLALEYAHTLREHDGTPLHVVHRDITPQNVFLTFDGQVKLLDFGVAKSASRAREKTREGVAKGCIAYMSPDHVAVEPIDHRADIFAVGVLLRELLTGKRLWGAATDSAIVHRLVLGDIPFFPIHSSGHEVPTELRRICEIAMAKDRADRFASARHMREALEWWLASYDAEGSLRSDLTALFEGPLASEMERVRRVHRLPTPSMPPTASTIELDTTDFLSCEPVTRAIKPPPPRPRMWPKREMFVLAMAIIASVAAVVAVASAVLDNDSNASARAQDIVVSPSSVATKTETKAQ